MLPMNTPVRLPDSFWGTSPALANTYNRYGLHFQKLGLLLFVLQLSSGSGILYWVM